MVALCYPSRILRSAELGGGGGWSLSDSLGTNRHHHCWVMTERGISSFELPAKEGALSLRKRGSNSLPAKKDWPEKQAYCTDHGGSPLPPRALQASRPPSPAPNPSFRACRATKLHSQIGIENQDHPANGSWTEPRAPVICLACHRVI